MINQLECAQILSTTCLSVSEQQYYTESLVDWCLFQGLHSHDHTISESPCSMQHVPWQNMEVVKGMSERADILQHCN